MRRVFPIYILFSLLLFSCGGGKQKDAAGTVQQAAAKETWELVAPMGETIRICSIDTMDVRNPFILFERSSNQYCMVADGGHMWLSNDLRLWNGPYDVLSHDTASWLGAAPVVTSPEIHKYNGHYYYMATFETPGADVVVENTAPFARHSCTALVADSITGPYKTIDKESDLLDVAEMADHPTFCTDYLNVGYMIYNHSHRQNGDGTVQIVRFTGDFSRRMGEAYVMFKASDNPWSGSCTGDRRVPSPVMEAPFLFNAGEESLGILFTSMQGSEKAVGVAYSTTGHLDGPWVIEPEPLLKGVGNAMMFIDYDGSLLLVANKDTVIGGTERSVAQFFRMDSQFDKLQVKRHYKF